jgi:hypothetical protein
MVDPVIKQSLAMQKETVRILILDQDPFNLMLYLVATYPLSLGSQ